MKGEVTTAGSQYLAGTNSPAAADAKCLEGGPVLGLQNTVAVNYAGNPALAIPIPLEGRGFPVTSLQLIGPNLGEARLVNAARLLASTGEPKPIAKNER